MSISRTLLPHGWQVNVGAFIGGIVSRILVPYEPGLWFIVYGGAGGLAGAGVVIGCRVVIGRLRLRGVR